MKTRLLVPFLALSLVGMTSQSRLAQAQDDAVDAQEVRTTLGDFANPEAVFQRTQAVLAHFGVPALPDPQPKLDTLAGLQTVSNLRALLPNIDPSGEFSKYAVISGQNVDFYQDRGGYQVPDFTALLRDQATSPELSPNPVLEHLEAAKSNPSSQPLLGLRIALDPGHMGGKDWDQITGKWVRDARTGRTISEGVINLQTALLLESELTRLGAEVKITRYDLVPVTSADFNNFDLAAQNLYTLQESSLLKWFETLVDADPIGPALYNAFSKNSAFRDVFSPIHRWDYYNNLDLQARVDSIIDFHPDITLIIHYDASCPASDPHGLTPGQAGKIDGTKVYISGAYGASELASREDRAEFAMHLLDQTAWDLSRALAHSVATTLSTHLKLSFDKSSPGFTHEIEPGVFSRNLYILNKYQGSATAYVENLFYNDPGEFEAISNATHPMTIGGQNIPYSDRVAQVADSLRDAVVKFVQNGF